MIGNGERKKISVSWVRKAECNGLDHNRSMMFFIVATMMILLLRVLQLFRQILSLFYLVDLTLKSV